MTGKPEITDASLDALFAEARETAQSAPDDLLARIKADADAEQQRSGSKARQPEPRKNAAARLLDALGGWAAISGLATAAVTGIWIGFANPSIVPTLLVEDDVLVDLESDAIGGLLGPELSFVEEG